ncbi:uncharacterized protein V6R79_006043 [Siganus canaliculatus]
MASQHTPRPRASGPSDVMMDVSVILDIGRERRHGQQPQTQRYSVSNRRCTRTSSHQGFATRRYSSSSSSSSTLRSLLMHKAMPSHTEQSMQRDMPKDSSDLG